MISFPFQHWLSEEDLEYMIEASRQVLSRQEARPGAAGKALV